MKVHELAAKLATLPQDRTIIAQVVGSEPGGGAWNMDWDINNVPSSDWMVVITVSHRELPRLPSLEPPDLTKLWLPLAYGRLGALRDRMRPEDVRAVQEFLGPLT